MSYLAEEMDRLMVKSDQSIDDLVPKSGLSRTQLYLWKRSEQTSISDDQLTLLAHALSQDIADHAALVRAHLMDEKYGPGSDLIEIEIQTPGQMKDKPRPRSRGESAMAYLAQERLHNSNLNELLLDLARVLGWMEPGRAGKTTAKPKASVSSATPHQSGQEAAAQVIVAAAARARGQEPPPPSPKYPRPSAPARRRKARGSSV